MVHPYIIFWERPLRFGYDGPSKHFFVKVNDAIEIFFCQGQLPLHSCQVPTYLQRAPFLVLLVPDVRLLPDMVLSVDLSKQECVHLSLREFLAEMLHALDDGNADLLAQGNFACEPGDVVLFQIAHPIILPRLTRLLTTELVGQGQLLAAQALESRQDELPDLAF